MPEDDDLWERLIKKGREIEKGDAHEMTQKQIYKVHDWIDYIGAPGGVENPMALNAMLKFDLEKAQYKLYDLTGMVMGGRWGDELSPLGKKIAKSYLICAEEKNIDKPKELYDCIDKEIYKL